MPDSLPRAPRRGDALSPARIVDAAIGILDAGGEGALTVRVLSERLATGRGALYHHVSTMDDLLAAAADRVVTEVIEGVAPDADPADSMRSLSLALFDALDAHPWVGALLGRGAGQPAVLRVWTAVGSRLSDLGIVGPKRSDAGGALVHYILGAVAQSGAGARRTRDDATRRERLDALAATWEEFAPDLLDAAHDLREHDDRAQFLAGIDIFLAGIGIGH